MVTSGDASRALLGSSGSSITAKYSLLPVTARWLVSTSQLIDATGSRAMFTSWISSTIAPMP